MEGRILTCVYCGYEYPQDTPAWGNNILTEHIKVCEKHPLRQAEATIAGLRSALAEIKLNELITACKEIKILEENHAQHVKGWKCGFFPDEDILKYTHGEVAELEAAPDDIHEMADSLVCLFSYCVRKNWSPDQVGKAIQFKLREKFKDLDKLIEEQKNA